MKSILLVALLISSPAMAQQMVGPLFNYIQPKYTQQEIALGKCFSNAPWVVPNGYYEKCIAQAKR